MLAVAEDAVVAWRGGGNHNMFMFVSSVGTQSRNAWKDAIGKSSQNENFGVEGPGVP